MLINKMEEVLTDRIVELDNAIVVPRAANGTNAAAQKSGVFDSDGAFVRESVTFRKVGQFNSEPDFPKENDIRFLKSRYMYGGVLFGHFGHFLVDSLARIWAVCELGDKIDGIVFTPKTNAGDLQRVARVQRRIVQALGVPHPIINTAHRLRVEKLYVPNQGIGLDDWGVGSPGFHRFVREQGGRKGATEGRRKLYLSRSALPRQRASYLSEKILVSHLEDEGYTVIHPQQHSIEEQIALYRAAEYVISPNGSPLHLLACVGNTNQKVAVIARRSAETNLGFERQLRAFHDCHVVTLNCLVNDWVPTSSPRPGRSSWGEFDMNLPYTSLEDANFISGDKPWGQVPEEALNEELANIEAVEGQKYHRYVPGLRP